MDFTALKTAIQNAIKLNGNEEITGDILQGVLLSMVSTLGDSAINDLVTAISNEATARQNGDSTLNGYIEALQGAVNSINTAIGNGFVYAGIATPATTPATGKVFYLALNAGTYTNFGNIEVSQGINILKYNGSTWSLDAFIGIDDAPTPSSNNLVKSGGVFDKVMADGSAFDISAHFASGGTLATYADLSAALTALNTLSAAYKKGGMSIKFVQSSDNKYVQYRLMADEWSTTEGDWQGVDDEPVAGSDNLVKSGGVKTEVDDLIMSDGSIVAIETEITSSGSRSTGFSVKAGDVYMVKLLDKDTITGDLYISTSFTDNPSDNLSIGATETKWIPQRTGICKIYTPSGSIGKPVFSIYKRGTVKEELNDNINLCKGLSEKTILENAALISGTTYFNLCLRVGIPYTISNYGSSTIVVYTTSDKTNSAQDVIESIGTINSNSSISFTPTLESNILRVYSNANNGKIKIENNSFSNAALKGELDIVKEKIDTTFVYSEQHTSWGYKNSLLKSDGTNRNGIDNAKITLPITVPNEVKSVYIKNIYIETGAYTQTCSIVAFSSENAVLGYKYFEQKYVRYDLLYDLPEGTSYIRLSSAGYPTVDDEYPTLYFLIPSAFYNNIIENSYKYYYLSKDIENSMNQICRLPRASLNVQANKLFVLSFISDIHYDIINLKRFVDFINKYKNVLDACLCGGDMVNYYWSAQNTSFDKWLAVEGAEDILLTIGNHDTAETGFHYAGEEGGSIATDVYSRIFSPLVDNWGVVQPSNAEENGLLYYYKDYQDKKIRLIVLDCMYWDDNEKIWLQDVLADAITNDLSVIAASHYMPGVITKFDCKGFNTLQGSTNTFLNSDAALCIQNFIEASALAGKGEFICWLAGHTHRDFAGVLADYPSQICITISCDSCAADQCAYCDSERVVSTISQDAIDVIAVDTYNKVIKVLRVGDTLDSWIRSRKTLTIDYINKTIINVE